jgi:hypothetical protein
LILPRYLRCLALALLPALAACGAKGPPLPPLGHRPEPVAGLSARQQGGTLLLEGKLPELYTDGAELEGTPDIAVVRVLPGGKPQELRRIPAEEVGASPGGTLQLRIPMEEIFAEISAERVKLHLILEAPSGKASRPGRSVDVVRAEPPPPPGGVLAGNQESGVRLSWEAVSMEESVEYHVYRRQGEAGPWQGPLGAGGLTETSYLDRDVQFDTSYQYQVRSQVVDSKPVRESDAASPLTVRREDRFPPDPPTAVRAVSVPGGIRIFWFPPESTDLAGFRLYRTAAGERRLLAELPADTGFYLDQEARPGTGYTYSLIAVDGARPPNESPLSEPTEETLVDAEGSP